MFLCKAEEPRATAYIPSSLQTPKPHPEWKKHLQNNEDTRKNREAAPMCALSSVQTGYFGKAILPAKLAGAEFLSLATKNLETYIT